MSDELEINDGMARAVVRPALGAGLVRFDWVHGGVLEPLFRPAPAGATPAVFDFASIVLLPWSNRVSGGSFEFEGRWHPLAPNVPGDPYPNHGNGFELAWQVARASATGVRLTVDSAGPGPYRYAATLDYAVAGGALTMAMAIENRGDSALPFGLGFHPWLVRDPDTLLLAPARAVWLEDAGHLPAGDEPVPIPAGWAFDAASPLPAGFINNAFEGWGGRARVAWPARGLTLAIAAAAPLSRYILYTPAASSGFFCFEPVSHPVDAYHLPGGPLHHGMVRLAPGEFLSGTVTFTARHLATPR